MRTLESGRLRLAVSTSGICFAPRLLGAFGALHPGVETPMQAHNRQSLVQRLARNEDDLYLFADAPEMEEAVAQELLPNPMVVLARDDHPLASERNISFARLAREPFLIREEGSGARRLAMRLFQERGLTPKIRMELGTNEAIKEAILAGLGVAILSRYTFGLDPESSRFVCLDVEGLSAREPLVPGVSGGQAVERRGEGVSRLREGAGEGAGEGELGEALIDSASPASSPPHLARGRARGVCRGA